ncbi:4-vinyl reductase [Methanocella sp. CWC-04]|uniref:4-vinyl reductase n=1 Tax=Methanooceanicella nereidis TaxID=2052831 RepID=A0AAP2RBE0_9EURY|nr:V4R domain-containing protein [Methanocella sp. CWC-04]MCD1293781.1 4-vinyl reductase [Methanocella sp. CWC-04]
MQVFGSSNENAYGNMIRPDREAAMYRAGKELIRPLDIRDIESLAGYMRRNHVGSLEIDSRNSRVFKVSNCLTCSTMEQMGRKACFFEAGLIAGALESIYGKMVYVRETKCQCIGDDVCEFEVIFRGN